MTRARAWAASVPPGVWTAVAGLVLLASVGVAVVLGAGLSVWSGGVGGASRPPAVVVAPPHSGLVVVTPPAAPVVGRPPVAPPAATAPPPARRTLAPSTPAVTPPVTAPVSARPMPPVPPGRRHVQGRRAVGRPAGVSRSVSALAHLLAVDRSELTRGLPARLSLTSTTLEQMTRALFLGRDVAQHSLVDRGIGDQEQVQAAPTGHAASGRGHAVPHRYTARHAVRSHGRHAEHRRHWQWHWRWSWHQGDDRD